MFNKLKYKIIIVLFYILLFPQIILANDKKEFFDNIANLIKENYKKDFIKIPESILLAQVALETGYGKSYAFNKKNNLFGLTIKGKPIKFKSKEESIISYYKTISNNNLYEDFRKKLSYKVSKKELIITLSKSYSKNPEYASLIIKIIQKYSLERYDT